MAHTTGEAKYLARRCWCTSGREHQVSRADGSWINDVTLSNWQGITVFHAIALAEALEHHGEVLDAATRAALERPPGRAPQSFSTASSPSKPAT